MTYDPNQLTYDEITKAYTDHITAILKASPDLKPYLFTKTFSPSREVKPEYLYQHVFAENDRIYSHLMSRLLKNHDRKRHLQPLSFDFLDLEGSQHRRASLVNLQHSRTPHVHSIMLVSETLQAKFQTLADEQFQSIQTYRSAMTSQRVFPTLTSMHAIPITDDLPRAISYATKLLRNDRARAMMHDAILFTQLPKPKSECGLPEEVKSRLECRRLIETLAASANPAARLRSPRPEYAQAQC